MLTNIKFDIIKPEFVNAAVNQKFKGELFSDRIWKNKAGMIDQLQGSMVDAMNGKTTIDKVARELKTTYNTSAYESRRLVNTEMARVQTQASYDIGISAGVEEIMWSATLDNLTATKDAELDGIVWGIKENHPMPPLHPNCRCVLINVPYKGWQPTQRKNNISKELIDYVDYNNWKSSLFKNIVNKITDLTTLELSTIDAYTGSGYMHINGLLREEGFDVPDWTEKTTEDLKEILNKTELLQDTQVYRGVSSKVLGDAADLIKTDPTRAIGLQIKDKGFISTSKDSKVAEKFIGENAGYKGDNILMEIKAPKGYHALEIGEKSIKGENEVLLINGSKIKITGVKDTRKILTEKETKFKMVDNLNKPLPGDAMSELFGTTSYEQKKIKVITEKEIKTGYIKLIGEVIYE